MTGSRGAVTSNSTRAAARRLYRRTVRLDSLLAISAELAANLCKN